MTAHNTRNRQLRIGLIAPPWFDVPPSGYGGIENVIADLVNELVRQHHLVTLLSAGRHRTNAQEHIAVFDTAPAEPIGSAFIETWYAARADAALPYRAELLTGSVLDELDRGADGVDHPLVEQRWGCRAAGPVLLYDDEQGLWVGHLCRQWWVCGDEP
jgi:hypothetical protein